MFDKLLLTEYNLLDFEQFIGKVLANDSLIKENTFDKSIIRNNASYEVVQIGVIDYEELNQFIIKSLNDYYNKINEGTNEEINKKKTIYKHLYQIWDNILQAENIGAKTVDDLYDDLTYALYTLGYKN